MPHSRLLLLCSILHISLPLVVESYAGTRKNTHATKHGQPSQTRPVIPKNSFANLSARKDGIDICLAPNGKGLGAFSTVPIAKGDVLGEYFGETLTTKEVEGRYWNLRKENKHDRKWRNSRKRRNQGISGDYLFDMGNDLFIDGEDADVSSWCRFANHADPGNNDCNVEVRARQDMSENGDQSLHLYFIALADIEKGVELQYDYGEDYWSGKNFNNGY